MLLSETQSSFQRFIVLLSDEECTLRNMDRQGLIEVNSQKEQVLDAMCRLEQDIEREFQQLSKSEAPESMWYWLKNTDDPRALSVQVRLTELQCLARSIQEQGRKNESLTQRTQQKVREAMHFIFTGWATGPVYQGSGTVNFLPVPSSVHLQG